jgi:RNA polymerase sigma-70 factor (ECF subfamily)
MASTTERRDDEGLVRATPTIGARVAHAAALAEAVGPEAATAMLDALPPETVRGYQPYRALRAHLLERLGRARDAREAYARAVGLSEDAAVREFLIRRSAELEGPDEG